MGEEDLELRMIRLRKMRQLLAARKQTDQQPQPKREEPMEELKRYLDERGREVLEEAASLNRALTERVAEALLRAIRSNALPTPIDAGDLYRLFRDLGLSIKLETSVKVLRHGEAKDLRKYLSEGI
jgi:DNA-binding TFAR19-related protein (PDSD5 family)